MDSGTPRRRIEKAAVIAALRAHVRADLAAVTRDEAVRSLSAAERKQLRTMLKRMRDDLSEITAETTTSELVE